MSDTPHLSLPLLAAAQAQKHVTMNEALHRLDALAAPVAQSADLVAPPEAAGAGDVYLVPQGAIGPWSGRGGEIAFFVNDGWDFAVPKTGWRVWVIDRKTPAIWDGEAWRFSAIGVVDSGAFTSSGVLVGDETLGPGGAHSTSLTIPDRAVVLGVTARVTADISGAGLTGWRLGVDGSADRYGSSIGLVSDSTVNGVTGAPVAYYGQTPLRIEPEGGDFTSGSVRLAIHFFALTPPSAV